MNCLFILDDLLSNTSVTNFAIEMIGHYGTGMPAGKTVFDTCVWIGRFTERFFQIRGKEPAYIMRKDEKINLCGKYESKGFKYKASTD